MPVCLTTSTPEETQELGSTLGRHVVDGTVIALTGDLGSGKTAFTQGLARGLGIENDYVTSPSYTLINHYSGTGPDLYHIDLYRLSDSAETEDLGLYGMVWNSFLLYQYPWRPVLYILIVCLLGLHLSHGVQSVDHTFGLYSDRFTPVIERLSKIGGLFIALGYSSIPIYVNIVRTPPV